MTALARALEDPPPVPGVGAASPLAGLARREVSRVDILSQSVAAIGPASGALIGTVAAVQISGTGAWLAVLLATLLAWSLAQVFGQFASRLAGAGSLYTFVAHAAHPAVALAVLLALGGGYAALAGFGLVQTSAHLWQAVGPDAPSPASAIMAGVVLLAGLVVLILTRGVRVSTRVTLIAEVTGLALLIAFVVASLSAGPLPTLADFSLEGVAPWRIVAATGVMTGAMLGFESAAALGAEASRPLASVPRAMSRSVLLAGVLYLFMVIAGASGGPPVVPVGAESVWIAQGLQSSAWLPVVHVIIALCFFPVSLAAWTALSRLLFVTGREETTHPALGVVHARTRVPRRAIVWSTPLVLAIPLAAVFARGVDVESSDAFATVAGPLMLAAYAITCFVVPIFLRRIGEQTLGWTVAPVVVGLAVLVIGVGDAVGWAGERLVVAGVVLATTAAGAALWARWWRRTRGAAVGLGTFDQTVQSDTWAGAEPR